MQATPATWRLLIDAGWRGGPAFKALVRRRGRCRSIWRSSCWSAVRRAVEHVRPDRDDGVVDVLAGATPGAAGSPSAARSRTRGVHARRPRPAVPDRRAGRDVHRRRRRGAGLPRRGRADGRAVRRRPVRAAEPGARAVPHGRPRPLARRRAARAPGPLDHQVKVRGYRIELGEIEAALPSQPAGAQAWWSPQRRPGRRARLVAYVVAPRQAPSPRRCASTCAQRLPDYMVPQHFVRWPRAADAERQDRSQGTAGARVSAIETAQQPRGRAADHQKRSRGRDLVRAARRVRICADGQLLRPGRPLAAGDARGARDARAPGLERRARAPRV